MTFQLPGLPYAQNALEPYISAKTIEFHYGKHHQTYVDNLNKLVQGTDFEKMPLEEIIKKTSGKPELAGIFNNAAQVWNHTFFWNSMSPQGGHEPQGELKAKIINKFGSEQRFYACSADNMNVDELISFLKEKGKFMPTAEGFTVDKSKVCDHE